MDLSSDRRALELVLLVLGLLLLLLGGDLLVRGASGLARALGVSPMVIGLTVVAFGTSAPELVINLLAALEGKPGLSFGNVVGSNLANLGLVLGCTALYRPMRIEGRVIRREIPVMIFVTGFSLILVLDEELRNLPRVFDRMDGICLLLLFAAFIYTAAGEVLGKTRVDPLFEELDERAIPAGRFSAGTSAILVFFGLLVLLGGGELTVRSASRLAQAIGLSEGVVGLVLVALGTSLPELVTSLLAARKGEVDLAIGNVVGSNVFNLLFVMGITSTTTPVAVPAGGALDLIVVLLLSLLSLPFCASGRRRLVRIEGAVLVGSYLSYNIWRVASGFDG